MKKVSLFFAVLVVVALVSNAAFAGLMVDIRAADGTKNIQPGLSTLEVWAMVDGVPGNAAVEKLQTVTGGVKLTGLGSFLPLPSPGNRYEAPWTFGEAAAVTLSADGKLLGKEGATTVTGTGVLYYRTATPGGETGNAFKLGTIQVNAQLGDLVNYVKSGASLSMYTFTIDGVGKTGTATSGYSLVTAGADVKCVPEPSTFILLGMGALALLAIRRRK